MRILQVPHAYTPVLGGVENQIQKVSENLVALGHDVHVLTTDVPSVDAYFRPLPRVHAAANEIRNGVHITRVAYGNRVTQGVQRILSRAPNGLGKGRTLGVIESCVRHRLSSTLEQKIRTWNPDVVLATPHFLPNVEIVVALRKRLNFPLAVMPLLHEFDPQWPKHKILNALAHADAVIANTKWEREQLIESYAVSPETVFVGGAGVGVSNSAPIHDVDAPFAVTFLGRKSLKKGIPLLLAAMKLVWDVVPEARLNLIGATTPDADAVLELIMALPPHLRSKIRSEDNVSNAEREQVLADTGILVLPSTVESFGAVILEAWSHCVPVLTLDLPVFREIVADGIDGFLVAPDATALANRIIEGARSRSRLHGMGVAGHRKVVKEFDWMTVTRRFLVALQAAAKLHGRPTLS